MTTRARTTHTERDELRAERDDARMEALSHRHALLTLVESGVDTVEAMRLAESTLKTPSQIRAIYEMALVAIERERDELRRVLLAEQGDPAGAPSGGWSMGGDGSWRKGGAPGTDITYRVVSFVAPARHGRAAVRAWRVRPAGGADIGGEAPTAREAMRAADAAFGAKVMMRREES